MKCRIQILHSDPLVFGVVFGLRHGGGECLNQDLQDLRMVG